MHHSDTHPSYKGDEYTLASSEYLSQPRQFMKDNNSLILQVQTSLTSPKNNESISWHYLELSNCSAYYGACGVWHHGPLLSSPWRSFYFCKHSHESETPNGTQATLIEGQSRAEPFLANQFIPLHTCPEPDRLFCSSLRWLISLEDVTTNCKALTIAWLSVKLSLFYL